MDSLRPERACKTGLVYNQQNERHYCAWDPCHAERPERTNAIMERLKEESGDLLSECHIMRGRLATRKEVESVHQAGLLNTINRCCANDPGKNFANFKTFSEKFEDVYINNASEEVALLAAGSAVTLVDRIWKNELRNGMAVIRPPGHHAWREESNGFCLLNNVAIAATHLLNERGAKRILIVDWDVHHGQGTQRIFYNDRRVLYISIHRYEDGEFWPHLRESNFDYIGEGDGKGFNVNIPLDKTGLAEVDYMAIFHQVIMPVAYEFDPEFVIVSAGYDSAIGCPEGRMLVSPAAYGHLTHMLSGLSQGKIAVVLEGGYCLESLAESALCTLETLLGRPCQILPSLGAPNPSVVDSILNVISVLRTYWKSLRFQEVPSKDARPPLNGLPNLPVHTPSAVFSGPTEPCPKEAYGTTPYYSPSEVVDFRHRIAQLKAQYMAFRQIAPKQRTCYAYDEAMLSHLQGLVLPNNVEWPLMDHPERIRVIYDHLHAKGLLATCTRVEVRPVDPQIIASCLSPEYATFLYLKPEHFVAMVEYQKHQAPPIEQWPSDLYATLHSQSSILTAVGALQAVVDEVMSNRSTNGFAIIRPPGHHAHQTHAAGFCFANNVAIVAQNLLNSKRASRFLIVDWDIHHGDGVQEAFYTDPRVLYVSIHRAGLQKEDPLKNDFYPPGPQKNAFHVGNHQGKGFNINLPWVGAEKTDGDYIAAFHQLVLPVAYEFAPEIVLVCCGFDSADGEFCDCKLTPAGFYYMTHMLQSLAGGKVVLALEGGYNFEVLKKCSEAVMRALMGLPYIEQNNPAGLFLSPSVVTVEEIKVALDVQKQYWQSLQYRAVLSAAGTAELAPVKRGRGRPRKVQASTSASQESVEPEPSENSAQFKKRTGSKSVNCVRRPTTTSPFREPNSDKLQRVTQPSCITLKIFFVLCSSDHFPDSAHGKS